MSDHAAKAIADFAFMRQFRSFVEVALEQGYVNADNAVLYLLNQYPRLRNNQIFEQSFAEAFSYWTETELNKK